MEKRTTADRAGLRPMTGRAVPRGTAEDRPMADHVGTRRAPGSFPKASLSKLRADRRGVAAVEYALIALLVMVAIVGALSAYGTGLSGVYTNLLTSF
jgi:Flp pilus assembly pilin Flp